MCAIENSPFYRKENSVAQNEKEIVRNHTDNIQHAVSLSNTDRVYAKENLRSMITLLQLVPVPSLFEDKDDNIEEMDVLKSKEAVDKKCKARWNELNPAGIDVPKPFKVLPYYSLQHDLVQYDSDSIRVLAQGARGVGKVSPTGARLLWTSVFDFHSKQSALCDKPRSRREKRGKKRNRHFEV